MTDLPIDWEERYLSAVTARRAEPVTGPYALKYSGAPPQFSTEPPTVAVTRNAASAGGVSAEFKREGRRLQLVVSGVPVAVAVPVKGAHNQYTVDHEGREWELRLDQGKRFSRASLLGDSSMTVQAEYEYRSSWRGSWFGGYWRRDWGWITGEVDIDDDLPPQVAALALRLSLGSWLYMSPRIGSWARIIDFWRVPFMPRSGEVRETLARLDEADQPDQPFADVSK